LLYRGHAGSCYTEDTLVVVIQRTRW